MILVSNTVSLTVQSMSVSVFDSAMRLRLRLQPNEVALCIAMSMTAAHL